MARSSLFLHFLLVFLTFSSTTQPTLAQTDVVELAKLLTIKEDWGSPAALSSWSSKNSTYCNWTGVHCNNGHVTVLSFPNFHIANPIPSSICNLNNLSYIDLSYNNLTGEFPTALYSCSALQYLDLSYNEFSGELPADINKLSLGMEHLNLSTNSFTGSLPSGIAGFPKLKSLVLDTNSFNGSYPSAAIGDLTELETLTLANNPFLPGPVPEEFSKLTKLNMLWLSEMNLTGGIPDALSSLTELTLLDLSLNKLHGEIPRWVWKHQKVQYLYLFANNFTGGIGSDITATNLLELDLSANRLTEPIPESIGNLKNLKLLYLYYNKITGQIPTSVALLPNLTDIRIFNNKLTGPLPPELGKHSPLGNLEACNNFLTGPVPDTLCFNKQLYDIVLFNNFFSGAFPAILGECNATLNNIMVHDNRFVGEFPTQVWSAFPLLTNVMIQNNGFTGTLPSAVSSNISRIEMGNNRFTGAVPSAAPGLKTFKAENNRFSGELPANMSGFGNLTDLDLSGNHISGSIPASILALGILASLNLRGNKLSGEIPAAIGLLPVLNILDLSNNELEGNIPQEFNDLHLSFLNLSSNRLSGEVPSSLQSQAYEGAFLRNSGGLCFTVDNLNLNIPRCGYYKGRNQMSTGLTILFSVLAGVTLIGVVGCLVVILRQKKRDVTAWKMTPFRALDFTECDVLTRLREADVIGSGGSGKVYRVHLGRRGGGAPGTAVVAVKRLWNSGSRAVVDEKAEKEFEAEVKVLGDIRHANIVSLLCCISSEDTRLLVYEYLENGSLDRWLHRRPDGLDWPTRLGIAIDAARGLSYMHHECTRPVMHRDVKSSNILLDPGFRAKIADFGLARILVKSGEPESVSAVGGTFGYMAPECGRGVKVSEKVDVYSFGVVLLELATGRVANDGGADCCLVEWAWRRYKAGGPLDDVVDGTIHDRAAFLQDAVAVFVVGVVCTGEDAASRPSMKQVLQQLVRYDRTASVAGACQDAGSAGKKGGRSDGKSSMGSGGPVYWDGGEDDSGNFVAHPV